MKVLIGSPRERLQGFDISHWDQHASVNYLTENTEAALLEEIVDADVLLGPPLPGAYHQEDPRCS